jgi:hypothetical protein
MASEHDVKQGEHLSRIATKYGFSDYRTIWDHPQNAALKRERQNPNVLDPGDRVHIPERELRNEARPTDKRHRFQVTVRQLDLRLVLEDIYEKPIAGAACDLIIEGQVHKLTSDSRGKIEQRIQSTAEQAHLILRSRETPFDGIDISVKIGHLNSVEIVSGQKMRLMNLGYYFGRIDEVPDPDFRSAVEEFQCDHFPSPLRPDGVPAAVDGICGPKTQAKLKATHGC